jgi:XTP/dITP diphosphohydrolase
MTRKAPPGRADEGAVTAGTRRIVIASDNRGKLAEIRQLLAPLEVEAVPQSEFGIRSAAETGSTFLANALIKARHASAGSGLPAIADDSGLEVAALGGRPGVHSARFAGESATDAENIDKLLADLADASESTRDARFRCVAVYVGSPGEAGPLVAEGIWNGRILEARRGSGGFGYDPVFFDPDRGKTAAEMHGQEKNRFSHRGQAFRALSMLLAERVRRREPVA